jgi:hypothetical protein
MDRRLDNTEAIQAARYHINQKFNIMKDVVVYDIISDISFISSHTVSNQLAIKEKNDPDSLAREFLNQHNRMLADHLYEEVVLMIIADVQKVREATNNGTWHPYVNTELYTLDNVLGIIKGYLG